MLTGLEPLLGPPLLKAAGIGAARAAGWGARGALSARRRKKVRSLLPAQARAAQLSAVGALDSATTTAILRFCESPELEHAAASLTHLYLLEGPGKKSDSLLASLKEEFNAALDLHVGSSLDPLVQRALFEALNEVTLYFASRANKAGLSASVEAEMLATVGSLATSSVRNTHLLQHIRDVSIVRDFQVEYRTQAAALHATMRLPHAGTTRQVPYTDLFVQPSLWVDTDVRTVDDALEPVSVAQILLNATRTVILGDPGGGKSTLSRKLVYDLATDRVPCLEGRVPFLVVLKDYANAVRGADRQTVADYLASLSRSPYNLEPPENAIEYLLLNDQAIVILDGLDELLDTSLRRDVVEAVEGFAHRYPTCPILVTSRKVGYEEAPLSNELFLTAKLGDFAPHQVHEYVSKWFALDESIPKDTTDHLTASFMSDSEFVADLRVNPLLLSLMCGIYASENYIPRNRPDVYEKCALLLFERWDKQRGIVPQLSFDAHVQAAMRSLALYMYSNDAKGPGRVSSAGATTQEGIARTDLIHYMTKYLREKRFEDEATAENAAIEFIDYCKGRAWVLTDIGADTYGFTHRTFLEYFAASQLVRLNASSPALYGQLRTEIRRGGWDVVAQLSVQILGRTVEDGADDFLELLLHDLHDGSSQELAYATSFAARSLQFVVPRPSVLRDIVDAALELSLAGRGRGVDARLPVSDLFACSTENAPRVAVALRASIQAALDSDPRNEVALYVALVLVGDYQTDLGSGDRYWRQWSAENWLAFAPYVLTARRSLYWLAVMSLERGDMELEEVLSRFGFKALYEYQILGRVPNPPFAYRVLQRRYGGQAVSLGGNVKGSRAAIILQDVVALAPTVRLPWLAMRQAYVQVAWVLGDPPPSRPRGVRAAQLLLSLPLIEMHLHGMRTADARSRYGPGRLSSPFREMAEVRDGRAPIDSVADLVSVFDRDSESRELFSNWLLGTIDTLQFPRPRRRRPSGTDAVASDAGGS